MPWLKEQSVFLGIDSELVQKHLKLAWLLISLCSFRSEPSNGQSPFHSSCSNIAMQRAVPLPNAEFLYLSWKSDVKTIFTTENRDATDLSLLSGVHLSVTLSPLKWFQTDFFITLCPLTPNSVFFFNMQMHKNCLPP